jgi:hypothetical protein
MQIFSTMVHLKQLQFISSVSTISPLKGLGNEMRLTHMDRRIEKEHLLIPEMVENYRGTPVEKVLVFKEELWNVFDFFQTKIEAYTKRNTLAKEHLWRDSWHPQKCIDFS